MIAKMTIKLTGKYRRVEGSAVAQCTQRIKNYGCVLTVRHGHFELALSRFPTNSMNVNGKKKLVFGSAGDQRAITVN